MRVGVIGAGSWGTALAQQIARAKYDVVLYGRDEELVREISKTRVNSLYAPGVALNPRIFPTANFSEISETTKVLILSLPSKALQEVLKKLSNGGNFSAIINTAKGLIKPEGRFVSALVREIFGDKVAFGVLSGPSFAKEVLEEKPTAVTLAASEIGLAREMSNIFRTENFRVYASKDLLSVQLGGVVKNIHAVAAGICDARKYGLNARAALLTRAIAETARLVEALGGRRETLMGLSGLGDLLLTATSDLSRNRRLGLAIGNSNDAKKVLLEFTEVAEAASNASLICQMASRFGVQMPIANIVNALFAGEISIEDGIGELLRREQKDE